MTFAMAKAPIEKAWAFPGFEDVEAGIVTLAHELHPPDLRGR